jgi:hypothetical protein
MGNPLVYSFSVWYYIGFTNSLTLSILSAPGCGDVHNNTNSDVVGKKFLTMKLARTEERQHAGRGVLFVRQVDVHPLLSIKNYSPSKQSPSKPR